jgi:hypothetical protein
VSGLRNPDVVSKMAAVFESYWESDDFVPYNPAEFRARTELPDRDAPMFDLPPTEIHLRPFQERLLEQIEVARRHGRHRNLLVAATGTGKTVMAAVDYTRLRPTLPRARLLFVAHRQEILEQSRATFRHALRDASFGELWVGQHRPQRFRNPSSSPLAHRSTPAVRAAPTPSLLGHERPTVPQPVESRRRWHASLIRDGRSWTTARRNTSRGSVSMLSKFTTQSDGTPSSRAVSSSSDTKPRTVLVSAATTTEPIRSATGSRVSTRTGRFPPGGDAIQISPRCIGPVRPLLGGSAVGDACEIRLSRGEGFAFPCRRVVL